MMRPTAHQMIAAQSSPMNKLVRSARLRLYVFLIFGGKIDPVAVAEGMADSSPFWWLEDPETETLHIVEEAMSQIREMTTDEIAADARARGVFSEAGIENLVAAAARWIRAA
jgi:hypothetical protein